MKKLFALCAILIFLCGCAMRGSTPVHPPDYTETVFALDTVLDISAYGDCGPGGISAAKDSVYRLEALLSVTDERSDISRVNSSGGKAVPVDAQTAELVSRALELSALTGGSMDLSIYPIVRAWGFTTAERRIPEQRELDELLTKVDYQQITVSGASGAITVPDGVLIDLGSIAKGYIGDRMIDALRESGVTSALVNLGGNVQTLGTKPGGALWKIAVRDPLKPTVNCCAISIGEGAVITSGGYERYFTGQDGQVYHHIIDPATGYPANSGLASVSVITRGSDSGLYGDGLSTALFVMGQDAALALWRELGGSIGGTEFELLLIADSGEITITPGLAGSVDVMSGGRLTVAEQAVAN